MKFEKAQFEAAAGKFSQVLDCTVPEVAFSGRSNVGKSSLINKILNRKSLARVSAQPGKTVTINFYNLVDARLVDLPGYGYARVSQSEKIRWSELIEGYFSSGRDIRIVVQLIDARHKPSEDDLSMIDYLRQTNQEFVVVLTKIDKLNKTQRQERLNAFPDELGVAQNDIYPFSSVTGEGTENIKNLLKSKTM